MSKTALFFPGQASQYVGMGHDLYEGSPQVRDLYLMASDEMGADLAELSFKGPAEELKRTRFTQPAILDIRWVNTVHWPWRACCRSRTPCEPWSGGPS